MPSRAGRGRGRAASTASQPRSRASSVVVQPGGGGGGGGRCGGTSSEENDDDEQGELDGEVSQEDLDEEQQGSGGEEEEEGEEADDDEDDGGGVGGEEELGDEGVEEEEVGEEEEEEEEEEEAELETEEEEEPDALGTDEEGEEAVEGEGESSDHDDEDDVEEETGDEKACDAPSSSSSSSSLPPPPRADVRLVFDVTQQHAHRLMQLTRLSADTVRGLTPAAQASDEDALARLPQYAVETLEELVRLRGFVPLPRAQARASPQAAVSRLAEVKALAMVGVSPTASHELLAVFTGKPGAKVGIDLARVICEHIVASRLTQVILVTYEQVTTGADKELREQRSVLECGVRKSLVHCFAVNELKCNPTTHEMTPFHRRVPLSEFNAPNSVYRRKRLHTHELKTMFTTEAIVRAHGWPEGTIVLIRERLGDTNAPTWDLKVVRRRLGPKRKS